MWCTHISICDQSFYHGMPGDWQSLGFQKQVIADICAIARKGNKTFITSCAQRGINH